MSDRTRTNVTLLNHASGEVQDMGDFDGVKMTGHLLRDGDGNLIASFMGGDWTDADGVRWSDVIISNCDCLAGVGTKVVA